MYNIKIIMLSCSRATKFSELLSNTLLQNYMYRPVYHHITYPVL